MTDFEVYNAILETHGYKLVRQNGFGVDEVLVTYETGSGVAVEPVDYRIATSSRNSIADAIKDAVRRLQYRLNSGVAI